VDGRRFRAVSPPLPSAAHRDWWRVPDAGEERARGSERRSR
jgi:hypothetical protein